MNSKEFPMDGRAKGGKVKANTIYTNEHQYPFTINIVNVCKIHVHVRGMVVFCSGIDGIKSVLIRNKVNLIININVVRIKSRHCQPLHL